jgi:branched-subunit amino acid transport protein
MSDFMRYLPYILVMAVVTYLIRMIPLSFFRKKITNQFVLSLLYYVPYAVLSAMTFPAILFGTSSILSAAVGLVAAVVMAFMERSLLTVALSSCTAALIVEIILSLI